MSDYNYETFDLTLEEPAFEAFRQLLHVGERAPSFPLEDLRTGETVEMSSLWKGRTAVIEFGSFT